MQEAGVRLLIVVAITGYLQVVDLKFVGFEATLRAGYFRCSDRNAARFGKSLVLVG
jgi:hypothetical protein